MFCLLGWWWWSCCWCPWTFSLWVSYWRGRDVESIFFDFQQASVGLYLLEQTRIFLLSTKDGMFQFCLLLLQVCILDLEFINGCISHAALGCNLCLGLSQLVSCIGQLNNVLEYKIRISKQLTSFSARANWVFAWAWRALAWLASFLFCSVSSFCLLNLASKSAIFFS